MSNERRLANFVEFFNKNSGYVAFIALMWVLFAFLTTQIEHQTEMNDTNWLPVILTGVVGSILIFCILSFSYLAIKNEANVKGGTIPFSVLFGMVFLIFSILFFIFLTSTYPLGFAVLYTIIGMVFGTCLSFFIIIRYPYKYKNKKSKKIQFFATVYDVKFDIGYIIIPIITYMTFYILPTDLATDYDNPIWTLFNITLSYIRIIIIMVFTIYAIGTALTAIFDKLGIDIND